MTPQMKRLVVGFLAAFVLLSVAPHLLEEADRLSDPATAESLSDLLGYVAAGLLAAVGSIALLRRLRARPRGARTLRSALGLGRRLRQASREGARAPELARRFQLSQDAVRAAIGRDGPGSAAPKGSSFRSRQGALPAKPRARAVPVRQTPYRALA
jgi:hypothetical protein